MEGGGHLRRFRRPHYLQKIPDTTVKFPALEPGTYAFSCGMDMQRGTLVVQ